MYIGAHHDLGTETPHDLQMPPPSERFVLHASRKEVTISAEGEGARDVSSVFAAVGWAIIILSPPAGIAWLSAHFGVNEYFAIPRSHVHHGAVADDGRPHPSHRCEAATRATEALATTADPQVAGHRHAPTAPAHRSSLRAGNWSGGVLPSVSR